MGNSGTQSISRNNKTITRGAIDMPSTREFPRAMPLESIPALGERIGT